ncbi:hypothetical protein GW952_31090 (plasmid) [Klebsiella michiganensis]|uniref:Uncharacterized protein n=1 Tax=Klebsiella michiganensis TaxID=1134687 RepID=A0A6P1V8M9_9ENTR|nr:hypothetical protein [Klebsiella michiganensis]QHS50059.1 hypothetical protein GW952_31090 [Klebsiella michiganensis]
MSLWLTGFILDIGGVDILEHHLISAPDLEYAELAATLMLRTWWPEGVVQQKDYCWTFPQGTVRFNNIVLLSEHEANVLQGLRFLDTWMISGSKTAHVLYDEYNNLWREVCR